MASARSKFVSAKPLFRARHRRGTWQERPTHRGRAGCANRHLQISCEERMSIHQNTPHSTPRDLPSGPERANRRTSRAALSAGISFTELLYVDSPAATIVPCCCFGGVARVPAVDTTSAAHTATVSTITACRPAVQPVRAIAARRAREARPACTHGHWQGAGRGCGRDVACGSTPRARTHHATVASASVQNSAAPQQLVSRCWPRPQCTIQPMPGRALPPKMKKGVFRSCFCLCKVMCPLHFVALELAP